ncbi:hypothetical protein BCR34DRAFT_436707, partial [Clohesyomyces aquaticus]
VPSTIEDLITGEKFLGYRYLWADRYSIPQDDEREKKRLIHGMGTIYRSSALSLIAAAGEGPEYGLPGVSPGLRKARDPIRIGSSILTPQYLDVRAAFDGSKWKSRGWKYQSSPTCL